MYDTVNSQNLQTANHNAHIIFVHHSAMKTHLYTNQNACYMNQIINMTTLYNPYYPSKAEFTHKFASC